MADENASPNVAADAQSAEDAANEALNAAQDAVTKLNDAHPFDMPSFTPGSGAQAPTGMDLLADVNLNVKIELGRTRMLVDDVLRLAEGSVIELDKLAGDPVDVYVNDRAIARGEVLVLNDNFCIRISEILAEAGDAA